MKLYTLLEAAEILRWNPEVTRRAARSGKLQGGKVGRCWRFTQADIDNFVDSGRNQITEQKEPE